MQHIVEYDITSNATIRRNYVERQFVECKSVENSSKVRRKLVVIWELENESILPNKRNVHASEKMHKIK